MVNPRLAYVCTFIGSQYVVTVYRELEVMCKQTLVSERRVS